MPFTSREEIHFLESLSQLIYSNPFLPERIELEKAALGKEFDESAPVWSQHFQVDGERRNVVVLGKRVGALAERLRTSLVEGVAASDRELLLYEDMVVYLLYDRYREQLRQVIQTAAPASGVRKIDFWNTFRDDFDRYLKIPGRTMPGAYEPVHLFACLFQIRRAFQYIYHFILGRSMPAARLRAAVWQSIFTRDMRRYRRTMFERMGDISTLIVGPSGTGKELVARAVGLSRFIPFDPRSAQFTEDFESLFHPLNLSALSPTLIESELFGHRKGSFTGAITDRIGWLELCRPLGTVFLDEVGEVDASIQVKLLRVMQNRIFQRLGDTADLQFLGKIIAATNRDLAAAMRAGKFREDFYYRLCSDVIRTPSLREQLADLPEDVNHLVLHLAARIAGDESEAVSEEVVSWIQSSLAPGYSWPGNIRELEQCVRSVLVRGKYEPAGAPPDPSQGNPRTQLASEFAAGRLPAEDILNRYCTIVYASSRSLEQAARELGLDRRTVKSRIDQELLARLSGDGSRRTDSGEPS